MLRKTNGYICIGWQYFCIFPFVRRDSLRRYNLLVTFPVYGLWLLGKIFLTNWKLSIFFCYFFLIVYQLHFNCVHTILRLNSEDFSNFFLRLDTLFQTYSDESTYLEVQKTAEIVSNILEYSWFFRLFRGFSYRIFYASGTQSRAIHQKNRHKILRRTVNMRSLSIVEQKWFYTKNCPKIWFYAG